MDIWVSKLGNRYPRKEIELNEKANKLFLDRLRNLPCNKKCADCGMEPTVWAAVNLGVFLCLRCGSIHRGIGTHISIPKGCTGTYLWGPDELQNMKSLGNDKAEAVYGGMDNRPPSDANHEVWKKFIIDKYQNHKFAPTTNGSQSGMNNVLVADLLDSDQKKVGYLMENEESWPTGLNGQEPDRTSEDDFFAQYGV